MSKRRLHTCTGCALLASLLLARASGAAETSRVSLDSAGNEVSGGGRDASLSANGRWVAFSSEASNLVAGDGNGTSDIFVHDRKTGETTRVSVDSSGSEGDDASNQGNLSANGRYVAFHSNASNLVPSDANDTLDVFVHDRKTGETTRVSVDSVGGEANDASFVGALSANGRYVTFQSFASNLVPEDANDQPDIFVHDRKTGETTRVSVDSASGEGNGRCFGPSLSANGRYVGFESEATNLVSSPDGNAARDAFIHDRKTGETTRISNDPAGDEGNGESTRAVPSANGRYILFESQATNLVEGDENGAEDVFLHDRKTGETTRVSVDSAGGEGNGGSQAGVLSANARYVAFHSDASNLASGDENGLRDVFFHDRKTGETVDVSLGSEGLEGSGNPAVSRSGRYVVFTSDATNLVPGDGNAASDVFVHDRK